MLYDYVNEYQCDLRSALMRRFAFYTSVLYLHARANPRTDRNNGHSEVCLCVMEKGETRPVTCD